MIDIKKASLFEDWLLDCPTDKQGAEEQHTLRVLWHHFLLLLSQHRELCRTAHFSWRVKTPIILFFKSVSFFLETQADAEFSITRRLSCVRSGTKPFPCRKKLLICNHFSLEHSAKAPLNVFLRSIGKTKGGHGEWRWEELHGWSPVPPIVHAHMYMKKHRQRPAAWFIFPLSLQFQEFYEWKMSGDLLSKATMACVSWAYHAVLVGSWRRDAAEGRRRDGTSAAFSSRPGGLVSVTWRTKSPKSGLGQRGQSSPEFRF